MTDRKLLDGLWAVWEVADSKAVELEYRKYMGEVLTDSEERRLADLYEGLAELTRQITQAAA